MAGTRVLIVEDDAGTAATLQALLQVKGYEVQIASDGPAAMETARRGRPQVVLLDIMLPRLGGFEVCKLLRADSKTQDAKIIVITGLSRMGDVENAFAAGANDYIIKPIDSERLLKKIERVLGA